MRLEGFDYTQPGAYFLSICTERNERLFGSVMNGHVILSEAGVIAQQEWTRTAEVRDNVKLDAFVIMPNHIHGILLLADTVAGTAGTQRRAPTRESFARPVPWSIPTVVRMFKASVTHRVRQALGRPDMTVWQRGYYERVVRGDNDLQRAREYILNNPLRWTLTSENPQGHREPSGGTGTTSWPGPPHLG
jgi:putative transposase